MSRKRKKWLSRMLALCLILALLPINTAYADEVDTQDAVYQTEDIQPAEAAAQPEAQSVEVKPEVQPEEAQPEVQSEETQPEVQPEKQPEEVKSEEQPEEVKPEEAQPEETQPEEVKPEAQPEEAQPEEVKPEAQPEEVKPEVQPAEAQPETQPEAPVEPDQGAAVEEAVEPAEIMLAPAASTEKIKKLELNLRPVTELRYLSDFAPISYSPSDKITLVDAYVYEGYDKKSGSRADSYQFYNAYTAVYEFKTNSPKYSFDIYTSGIKINSHYIKDWSYECGGEDTLKIYVSYPSLEKQVRVTFKSRDKWSDTISSMFVGHNLDTDFYSVWLSYYNGLNQIDGGIDRDAAYDPTKDYSVCIYVAGRFNSAIISPDLTKDDVKINQGTIWKVAWDDDNSYTKIYVNFPREEDSEYTVKAKNAEITNAAGEPVSKAKAGTVLTVKLKELDKRHAFEKWVVDDNSTDVKFDNEKSTTTTFTMPKGEVYISPAKLWKTSVYSKKLTYNGEEQTGVVINPSYAGTLTGHQATEAGTYTATASLNKGYSWSDGTTGDREIEWTIAKADRDGPRQLAGAMPTKEGANDGRILATTTEMEYRKVGTITWKDCPDEEVTGLSTGDYEVRYKDTTSYNKSIALIYTVPIWGPKTWITWIENGTPDGINLPKNATITITANPPEKGKEFDKWVPNASSNVKFEDEKSEVTKMTVLGGNVTVRATYKEKEIPGAPKYDLHVINGQGSGQYAYNRTVDIKADPAPEGKTFDKWVVIEETVTVTDITKAQTTLRTKGVEGWVVATYKDIESVDADHTLTVVNGSISGSSNPGTFKRNEEVTLIAGVTKNFEKWVVTSGSVETILPNENALNVTIITSDEDTTIEATYKPHSHTYGGWSKNSANHWHECTDPASCTDRAGSVKDKASHVYSDAADTICNVCGYVRTVAPPTPSTPSTPSTPGSPSAPSAPAAPVEPDTLNVTVSNIKVQNYKGTGITPKIMVKDPATRKKLKQGKHYTVSYENNVNVGTAAIVIRGIEANGYSGVKYVYFTIQPQSVAKKVKAKVNGKKFLYTGNELTPGVNLTYNKRKLTEGVDYVLSYSNNVGKGSAKITITGIGNYTGSKTVKFRITGPKLKDAKVSLVPNGTPYPDITVTYAGKTRTMGQDYTIKYPKLVKPGKNRIIVKGRGNFSGSVKLTYYQEGL